MRVVELGFDATEAAKDRKRFARASGAKIAQRRIRVVDSHVRGAAPCVPERSSRLLARQASTHGKRCTCEPCIEAKVAAL